MILMLDSQVFSVVPEAQSWANFNKYARRVRHLSYSSFHLVQLERRTFLDIARTCPGNHDIFPNLHTLVWGHNPEFATLFMHSRVTRFMINIPEHLSPVTTACSFFPKVYDCMPNITHLDIRVDTAMASIQPETVELLSALPRLKNIVLGQYQLTSKVAECLSILPDLSVINVEGEYPRGMSEDIYDFSPSLHEGAFPALTTLIFDAQFHDAQSFLTTLATSAKLEILWVNSPEFETELGFKNLIACIVQECPNVDGLSLASFVDPQRPETSGNGERINMHTLKPLFHKKHLTSLTVVHQYPLDLNSVDLEKISLTWPSLHTLRLNAAPGHFMTSDLTLEALVPFARNCPKLRLLGLFMNAKLGLLSMSESARFQCLEALDVGLSLIDDDLWVTQILRQVFPPDRQCTVASGMVWDPRRTSARGRAVMVCLARIGQWMKVDDLLYQPNDFEMIVWN